MPILPHADKQLSSQVCTPAVRIPEVDLMLTKNASQKFSVLLKKMHHGKQKHRFSALPYLELPLPLKEKFTAGRQARLSQGFAPFSPEGNLKAFEKKKKKNSIVLFLQTGILRHRRVNSFGPRLICRSLVQALH